MKYRAQSPHFNFITTSEPHQRVIGHNLDVLLTYITRDLVVEKSKFPQVIKLSIIRERLDFKIVADVEAEELEGIEDANI